MAQLKATYGHHYLETELVQWTDSVKFMFYILAFASR